MNRRKRQRRRRRIIGQISPRAKCLRRRRRRRRRRVIKREAFRAGITILCAVAQYILPLLCTSGGGVPSC